MNKTNLARNLKKLLLENVLTESELARKTGVGQPVINRMISGATRNPKIETLKPIAQFFAISVDQLIGNPAVLLDGSPQIPLVPLEEVLMIDSGKQHPKIDTHIFGDAKWGSNSYALKLRSDDFLPLFPEGTLLIFDPDLQLRHKDFALIHMLEKKIPTIRQVLIDDDEFYLKPINPDFKTIPLSAKHKILSVMVQARIDFV